MKKMFNTGRFSLAYRGQFLRVLGLGLALPAVCAHALENGSQVAPAGLDTAEIGDLEKQSQQYPPPAQTGTEGLPSQPVAKPAEQTVDPAKEQPKRILGVMPNFRAVSAGALPPPPTPKEAFVIATKNSFDYSSFIFVGLTSMIAEGSDAHRQLGKGVAGFGRYYWRGFVDKTNGNYLVIFALPTVFHEDERYFARGKGGFVKRFIYSTTRIFITPNYEGNNTINASELLGRGMAQGISLAYYPSKTRTLGAISAKYGYALLRDAATNAFREFWPDIATHVLHRHP
ncbi:MAG TPA: hypothetical protein VMR90_03250 [Candidatus Cybelea sp.]|nr:hypothetical protein [Candidatus Cybelea sp.]